MPHCPYGQCGIFFYPIGVGSADEVSFSTDGRILRPASKENKKDLFY